MVFAVVAEGLENNRALSFLRYIKSSESEHGWKKLDTAQANSYLEEYYPSYLYHSPVFDADLHAVPIDKIQIHHQTRSKLKELINSENTKKTKSKLQEKLFQLINLLIENGIILEQLGVTGSFLIGAENDKSDIDLVIYDRNVFHQARQIIQDLIGEGKLSELEEKFWKDSYQRRSCSLTFEEYIWHEKRKYNKAVFQGIKFDLSLLAKNKDNTESAGKVYKKQGNVTFTARVLNDQYAFDTPCSYSLDHPDFKKVICFTPTYTGQAIVGETVEISGFIERSEDGTNQRIIVGSSREAEGEYIKVVGGTD